jgi:flagellar hook-length control protein FliK
VLSVASEILSASAPRPEAKPAPRSGAEADAQGPTPFADMLDNTASADETADQPQPALAQPGPSVAAAKGKPASGKMTATVLLAEDASAATAPADGLQDLSGKADGHEAATANAIAAPRLPDADQAAPGAAGVPAEGDESAAETLAAAADIASMRAKVDPSGDSKRDSKLDSKASLKADSKTSPAKPGTTADGKAAKEASDGAPASADTPVPDVGSPVAVAVAVPPGVADSATATTTTPAAAPAPAAKAGTAPMDTTTEGSVISGKIAGLDKIAAAAIAPDAVDAPAAGDKTAPGSDKKQSNINNIQGQTAPANAPAARPVADDAAKPGPLHRDPRPQAEAAPAVRAASDMPQPPVLPQAAPANAPAATDRAAAATAPQAVAVPVAGIAVEIASKAFAGKNRFEIRLDPPELGRIHVRLDVDRNGEITSHVMTERQDTLDLLRRDAPTLERALQDAGLRTANNGLQFSLRDHGFGRNDQPIPVNDSARLVVSDESLNTETMPPVYRTFAGSRAGLDIRV